MQYTDVLKFTNWKNNEGGRSISNRSWKGGRQKLFFLPNYALSNAQKKLSINNKKYTKYPGPPPIKKMIRNTIVQHIIKKPKDLMSFRANEAGIFFADI